jgi:hypothetical protein
MMTLKCCVDLDESALSERPRLGLEIAAVTRFQQALDAVDSECTEIWATKEEAVRAQIAPHALVSDNDALYVSSQLGMD